MVYCWVAMQAVYANNAGTTKGMVSLAGRSISTTNRNDRRQGILLTPISPHKSRGFRRLSGISKGEEVIR
jgi:hypothetical protein